MVMWIVREHKQFWQLKIAKNWAISFHLQLYLQYVSPARYEHTQNVRRQVECLEFQ